MPPEWARHERTIMGWPCRRELWESQLEAARIESAGVANAIAAFEPVTMIAATPRDAAAARAACSVAVEVVQLAIDDSWLRDSGPVYVVDDVTRPQRRLAVHFGFNAWGEKFHPFDADAAIGGRVAEHLGDEVVTAPLILEGGSILVDGAGTLLTTRQCLLHPNRNPGLSREQIEGHLRDFLGLQRVVWLDRGLVEDRDTDGHVDLIAAFTAPGRVLIQSTPAGTEDHEPMAANHAIARAAGLEVGDFPVLTHVDVAGERSVHSYLNSYVGDRFVIVPLAGQPEPDEEALARLLEAFPAMEVVGVPGAVHAYGGGGPHCITQQVPAVGGHRPEDADHRDGQP
jgi:agmatine deiminase